MSQNFWINSLLSARCSTFSMGQESLRILHLSSDYNMRGIICQIKEFRRHLFIQHNIVLTKNYLSIKHESQNDRSRCKHSFRSIIIYVDHSDILYKDADIKLFKLKLWKEYFTSNAGLL